MMQMIQAQQQQMAAQQVKKWFSLLDVYERILMYL